MNILVVDDGKEGHTRQSSAVAELVSDLVRQFEKQKTNTEVLKLNISKYQRWILELLLCSFPRGAKVVGKWIVQPLNAISALDPDVIISCGRTSSVLSALYKKGKPCTKICILYPGWYSRKEFDLLVVPEHDFGKVSDAKNVIRTKLAICNTTRTAVKNKNDIKRIGVLFGGRNKSFVFNRCVSRKISAELVKLQFSTGAQLLWSSSRRTPVYLVDRVESELKKTGNQHQYTKEIKPLLELCDWVIVSADSVSMVSEALAWGCKVTVFIPPARFGSSGKHERFVENLQSIGALNLCTYDQLGEQIPSDIEPIGLMLHKADNDAITGKLHEILQSNGLL